MPSVNPDPNPARRFSAFGPTYFRELERFARRAGDYATSRQELRDGREAHAARLALINNAKSSLVLSTYAIVHDEFGFEIMDALVAAAKRGVTVVLSLDQMANVIGSLSMPAKNDAIFNAKLAALEAAGGMVSWYATFKQQLKNFASGNHFKMLAADGEVSIDGGRNIGGDYVDRWTDFDLRLTGPVAASKMEDALSAILAGAHPDTPAYRRAIARIKFDIVGGRLRGQRQVDEMRRRGEDVGSAFHAIKWDPTFDPQRTGYQRRNPTLDAMIPKIERATDVIEVSSDYRVRVPELEDALRRARDRGVRVVASDKADFVFDGEPAKWDPVARGEGRNPNTEALIATFDRAVYSIKLSSNYVWGVPELEAALVRAKRRGVRVTVATTGEDESTGMAIVCYQAARDNYPAMTASGIRVRETTKHEHAKLFLVDDEIAAYGSYNMEYPAHDKLIEGLTFTKDVKTVSAIKKALDDTIDNRSKPVEPKKLSFLEWLMMLFGRLFLHFFV